MIKTVIFDMDGVIADTEPLHEQARNVLLRKLGLDVERISPTAIGRSKRAFWGEVSEKYKLPYSAEQLTVKEFDLLMKIAEESKLKPSAGLCELLEYLKQNGIKAAVASSSDRNYVECILEITNLTDYFFATSCGDDVSAAKPAPDVYLNALTLCGTCAEEAIAIEDSDTGAKAAKAAGIACIAYDVVTDEKLKQSFAACAYKIKDMRDIENIVQGVDCNRYAI